jgi:xylose dehydrogenase (NAD/NADP)
MAIMNKEQILRWGLLSTARINQALIPPVRKSKRSQLLAVASRRQESADKFAQTWQIPRTHSSYDALLSDPEIDVIYNPLPNSMHAEWSIKAVQAGKHVLCEKPLAIHLEEVDAMRSASLQTGEIITEAFMYRHHPQTFQVKEILDSGAIGKIHLIRGSFTYITSRPKDVRLEPALGGGCIWDVGCYPISYARTMIGLEPEEVFGWQILNTAGVDINFIGQLRFPGDIYAQFHSSFITPHSPFIEIVGSQGTLMIPRPFTPGKNEKIILKQDDKNQVIRIPGNDLYQGEVTDIEDSILHGKPSRITLEDSRNNTAVILALLESAQSRKPVHPTYQ